MLDPRNILAILVVGLSAVAAACDLRSGIIPNRLIAVGFALLLLVHTAIAGLQRGWSGVGIALSVSALGLVACALIPLALYLPRGLGGGDVKLFAVCGLGLGPILGLEAQLYAFGLGALFAFGRAAYEGVLWQTLSGSTAMLTNPFLPARMKRPVPKSASTPLRFGPAICLGVVSAVALHWRTA